MDLRDREGLRKPKLQLDKFVYIYGENELDAK